MAKLKKELLEPASGGGGGDGRGFDVHKVGDSRVGFVGAPPQPQPLCFCLRPVPCHAQSVNGLRRCDLLPSVPYLCPVMRRTNRQASPAAVSVFSLPLAGIAR